MAYLLPNGKQQFLDANGDPLANGTVTFYIPNTTTPKDTWQDPDQATLNTNPVVLDAGGYAVIYGFGSYRQILKDEDGNLIWDQLTSSGEAGAGYAWGGESGGSANAQTLSGVNFSGADGTPIAFRAGYTNTGATTLTIGTNAPVPILRSGAAGPTALVGGEIVAENVVLIVYDLARGAFQMVETTASAAGQQTVQNNVIVQPTLTLKQSTNPTPTAEGRVEWDTDDNAIAIGDGLNTLRFFSGKATFVLQVFTSGSGTYTPTTGLAYALVIATGGGGGGGGADSSGSTRTAAGGGGAGGTAIGLFSAATIGASKAYAVGAAGTAGSTAGGNGGTGGTTTFGSGPALLTAVGGTGGTGTGAGSSTEGFEGGPGGTASSGTLNVTGGDGDNGIGEGDCYGGQGGASFWGGGGRGPIIKTASATAGNPGKAYGSGGGGGANENQTAGITGGAGLGGVVFILELVLAP